MKKGFHFTLNAIFVLEIFEFLFWIFGQVGKWLDKKAEANFKIYNGIYVITNNYNTHIANITRSKGNPTKEFGHVI